MKGRFGILVASVLVSSAVLIPAAPVQATDPVTTTTPLVLQVGEGASGEITYQNCAHTFLAEVTVRGLLEGGLYQLKLEGMPTCLYGKEGDDWSNETIGYLGRWWQKTPDEGNISDAEYEAHPEWCVLGYLLFDCFTFTPGADGSLTVPIAIDSSYHVCGEPQSGRPAPGTLVMPKGSYRVRLNVTRVIEPHVNYETTFLSEESLEFTVAPSCPCAGGQVDIGDPASEDGHNLTSWGPIEPATHGGSWGASGPTGTVDNCRCIWDQLDDNPAAEIALTNCFDAGAALMLTVRHLDGIADDSFDVKVKNAAESWVNVGHYTDWEVPGVEEPIDQETWLVTDFDLSGVTLDVGQPVEVELTATGSKWSGFDTFGQVAFDWIKLSDDPPAAIPMSRFEIDYARVYFSKRPNNDRVYLRGNLELDLINGDGVDIAEDVTVTVGPLSETITMIEREGRATWWRYRRPRQAPGKIRYLSINWQRGTFYLYLDKADLGELTNPVTASILIGDDFGEESISMIEKGLRWVYLLARLRGQRQGRMG